MKKLKIGLAGAGHLGKIHLHCIGLTEVYDLVGFFDSNPAVRDAVAAKFNIKAFDDIDQLIAAVDVLDIVTPTTTHFEVAGRAIANGKHVFIEKPVTHTLSEAAELVKLKNEHQVKVQVGHVERFNPAFLALQNLNLKPKFIEGHRLAAFNPRGTDVSVVLDLMIHDLDLILKIVADEVVDIRANGVKIVSTSHDLCNARLTFKNGCVVNITASRLSLKQMRKLRLFQSDAYISMDFLEKEAQVIRLTDAQPGDPADEILETATGPKRIQIDMPPIPEVNAIKMELESFYECIIQDVTPYVSLEDGYKALKLAHKIIEACDSSLHN
jgi:predicted dehydrogenase